MHARNRKTLSLLLFCTLFPALNGCKQVVVPDVRKCTVAGIFAAGADCSYTGHVQKTRLTATELIQLLEAGAVITSHEDALKEKNAMEIACYDLGDNCTYEQKAYIKGMVPDGR